MSSIFSHSTPQDILNLKKTHIFIVGDVILDTYIEGQVSRISPEAPVPVVHEYARKHVAGGAGNVAANIASMGAKSFLCARVGNDPEAHALIAVLQDLGINTESLLVSSRVPTTTKIRVMSGQMTSSNTQQIVRVDKESLEAISTDEENQIFENYQNFLLNSEKACLVISDYGKGVLTKDLIQRLVALSHLHNVPIVTDPKCTDVSRYSGSTVIKPNFNEGFSVYKLHVAGTEHFFSEKLFESVCSVYLKQSNCENIVMSLSEKGVMVDGKQVDAPVRISSYALQVSDVSGAGDTLIAFLAMGLASGFGLIRATELGNIAAGIVCGKRGTATLSPSEFMQSFKESREATHPEKVIELENLAKLIQYYKLQNKRSVFTNGCFDILHAGHVDYLQKARALGDLLIVGLNSDESVRRLKGKTRPVQTSNDRAKILASLACVDYVVVFEEDTPIDVILSIKPNILVKGADYSIENTVGAKEVISWGGAVEHIPLVSGRSTTSIIEKAQLD